MASHKNDPQKGADVNEERRYVIQCYSYHDCQIYFHIQEERRLSHRKSFFNFNVVFNFYIFLPVFY